MAAGTVGSCIPLLLAVCVLLTWVINKLVDLLHFKAVSHILHLASLLFFSSSPTQDFLLTDLSLCFFLRVGTDEASSDAYTVSEPFGVGVVWPFAPLCGLARH